MEHDQHHKPYVCVIGLGKTGLSAAQFLTQRGFTVIVFDTRANPPELATLKEVLPSVTVILEDALPALFTQASFIVISPGVSVHEDFLVPAVNAGVEIIGDIELFAREVTQPVIAITGSNGKSTVTSWVGHVLTSAGYQAAVIGNIGQPVLEALRLASVSKPDVYVVELSSFQLETTHSLCPKVGCCLNISPDHMDRYDSFNAYVSAKKRIFNDAENVVFNALDTNTHGDFASDTAYAFVGDGSTVDIAARHVFAMASKGGGIGIGLGYDDTVIAHSHDITLKGQHNLENALAVMAICKAFGLTDQQVQVGLSTFSGLPHRCESVVCIDDIEWINDSKGTNVGATSAALNGLGPVAKGKIILIAGGDGKNGDFALLQEGVKQYVRDVITLGRDGPAIQQALCEVVPCHEVPNLKAAVQCAQQLAQPGDMVLLSPACASFDMFKNYQERGEQFKQHIHELIRTAA